MTNISCSLMQIVQNELYSSKKKKKSYFYINAQVISHRVVLHRLLLNTFFWLHFLTFTWITFFIFTKIFFLDVTFFRLQFPRVQSDIFRCLVLSDQWSNTQKYSVYNHIKQINAVNTHNGEAGTREWWQILLKNVQKRVQFP